MHPTPVRLAALAHHPRATRGIAPGASMKRAALFAAAFCLAFITTSASAQTTYTWNQTASASWAVSTNWTPTRTTPANTDILVFNNGTTTTATNVPTQTIGKLQISGNTTVTLSNSAAATLTISGGTGALSVDAGCTLTNSGPSSSAITNNLPAGSSGSEIYV